MMTKDMIVQALLEVAVGEYSATLVVRCVYHSLKRATVIDPALYTLKTPTKAGNRTE